MLLRKLLLLLLSMLLIYGASESPFGRYWLGHFILAGGNSLAWQMENRSVEQRKAFRYGNLYMLCNLVANTIDSNNVNHDDVLVLLPPTRYLYAHNVNVFAMPDPSAFYCLTHLKSVWITSPDVNRANWVILPGGRNSITLVPIVSDQQRSQLLDSFAKFTPSL